MTVSIHVKWHDIITLQEFTKQYQNISYLRFFKQTIKSFFTSTMAWPQQMLPNTNIWREIKNRTQEKAIKIKKL